MKILVSKTHSFVDLKCVRRYLPCGTLFFRFLTFRIIMEIWDFCVLKYHWKIIEIVYGCLWEPCSYPGVNLSFENTLVCWFKVCKEVLTMWYSVFPFPDVQNYHGNLRFLCLEISLKNHWNCVWLFVGTLFIPRGKNGRDHNMWEPRQYRPYVSRYRPGTGVN